MDRPRTYRTVASSDLAASACRWLRLWLPESIPTTPAWATESLFEGDLVRVFGCPQNSPIWSARSKSGRRRTWISSGRAAVGVREEHGVCATTSPADRSTVRNLPPGLAVQVIEARLREGIQPRVEAFLERGQVVRVRRLPESTEPSWFHLCPGRSTIYAPRRATDDPS
jgi:hypothetical protein